MRLPETLLQDAELIALVDGITFSELARQAIGDYLAHRGLDPAFRARAAAMVARERKILERLA